MTRLGVLHRTDGKTYSQELKERRDKRVSPAVDIAMTRKREQELILMYDLLRELGQSDAPLS